MTRFEYVCLWLDRTAAPLLPAADRRQRGQTVSAPRKESEALTVGRWLFGMMLVDMALFAGTVNAVVAMSQGEDVRACAIALLAIMFVLVACYVRFGASR